MKLGQKDLPHTQGVEINSQTKKNKHLRNDKNVSLQESRKRTINSEPV